MVEQLKELLQGLLGDQAVRTLSWAYYAIVHPLLGEPRLNVVLLASTILVATAFFVLRARPEERTLRGVLAYLFPRRVFLHPSAILDYKFFITNQLLLAHLKLGGWVISLVGLLYVSDGIKHGLEALFGPAQAAEPTFAATVAFTLATVLAWDFGKFLAHYIEHKVPFLWEFHKVHHAAEALVLFTANRVHPIELMLDLFMRLVCIGAVAGVFVYLYPNGITELTILGFNAVAFVVFYWIGHLQHSHIALGYGNRLSRWLVSPLMHQVHHSRELRHWDRNFGFVFSIWDRMFRSLYVPAHDEQFRVGLPEGTGRYDTLAALYFKPFVGAWRLLAGKGSRARTVT